MELTVEQSTFVEKFFPLAMSIRGKMLRNYGYDNDPDLAHDEMMDGLLAAAKHFDPARGKPQSLVGFAVGQRIARRLKRPKHEYPSGEMETEMLYDDDPLFLPGVSAEALRYARWKVDGGTDTAFGPRALVSKCKEELRAYYAEGDG